MSTTRNPIRPPVRLRITPEMVALFRRASEIVAADDHQFWEHEGGKKGEWYDISVELHSKLGRELWQIDVCDLVAFGDPDWIAKDAESLADWKVAREIRRRLEEAIA
jgi:hypothetical protein